MDYTIEVEIAKPRDEVVSKFWDGDSLPFWQPGFVSMEEISGEPGKQGSKTRLRYKNRGQDVELIETITVSNPPEEFSATFEISESTSLSRKSARYRLMSKDLLGLSSSLTST